MPEKKFSYDGNIIDSDEWERDFIEASLNAIPDIFYVIDAEGDFQRWNDKLPQRTGYTDEEIGTMNALEFFTGEDRETIESSIETVLQTGEAITEAEITTKEQDTIPHEFRGVRQTDAEGTPTGIIGIGRDITIRKYREEELKALTTRFDLALSQTDTGIWELDIASGTVRWDTTSERLFGYDPGEFPGTYAGVGSRVTDSETAPTAETTDTAGADPNYRPEYGDRIPDEDLDRVSEQLEHAITTGEQYQADFRVQPPHEPQRWIQARGVVEYNHEGSPDRVIGVQTDITAQKERERELEQTKQTLEEKNERLNQFAATVSHDLRNPLEIAQGYLDVARETGEEDAFETIERSLGRMESMIDELLTLARTETADPETESLRLADIVAMAWETTQTGEATITCDLPESMTVVADQSLLKNIFENLFRNAVEHNESPVTVSVGALDAGGFYIEDTGAGLPETDAHSVFEQGFTTNDSGTGFGLAISRNLIEAHGWTITATEGEAGGARFEIHTDGS